VTTSNRRSKAAIRTLVLLCTALAAGAAGAQTQPPPPTQPADPARVLVTLNRAIQLYLDDHLTEAAAAFQELLQLDPGNITASYYLGLINLREGLGYAERVTPGLDPQQTAELRANARKHFEAARRSFEDVIQKANERALTPVGAALLLGIAQLASEDPAQQDVALELALRAKQTLEDYLATDFGAQDRFAHFYLGVAQYRLADEYYNRKDFVRANDYVRRAKGSFRNALSRAADEVKRGTLSSERFAQFETVVIYYEGLIFVQERNYSGAMQKLQVVVEKERGRLQQNAKDILESLKEQEAIAPSRITFDSPVGPLEFDAELAISNAYDTNVILLGKDTLLPRGFKRNEDYRFGLDFGFTLSRYISGAEVPAVGQSLTIGVGGLVSNAWQPNIQQFDVNTYLGRAYVNWQPIQDFYAGLQYEYSYTKLGQDPFISSNSITPVISKVWRREPADAGARQRGALGDEAGRTDIYYTYDYRDYFDRLADRRLNRDGKYHALGIRHTANIMKAKDLWPSYFASRDQERTLLGNRWSSVYAGYVYRNERTRGTEFDLWGHSLIAGLEIPLPLRFGFEFDAEFTWEEYTARSVFDYRRNERSDFVQRYDFGFTHTLVARGEVPTMRTLEVKLRAGIALTFQDSNIWDRLGQDIYEYDRQIYGLELLVGF